ncbi:unnamed protein product [Ilex paraguariensis]|uniref:CLAVATA3/ESR (CLE)-related protein 45 n=1 Tax=Ilex paraguariensis TaxID=185542 RepID=A0ABC8R2R5_9AQUA
MTSIYLQEWIIRIEGLQSQTSLVFHYSEGKTSLLPPFFCIETMVCSTHRVFILLICIGILAIQLEKVSGLRSRDFVLRWSKEDHGRVLKNKRMLRAVVQDLNTMKKQAPVNKTFDPNQSSKRRVRRGSDPIHNRS